MSSRRNDRARRPRLPRSTEGAYIRETRKIWKAAQLIIAKDLEPILQDWPEPESKVDAAGELTIKHIHRRLVAIESRLIRMLDSPEVKRMIRRIAVKVNRFTTGDLERLIEIDLSRSNKQIDKMINVWTQNNVDLISTGIVGHETSNRIRPSMLMDIVETVESAHRSGARVEVLRRQIMERFDVSRSRADLIARDQVLKLNGQITERRQTAVGVTQYRWSTSRDERVRDQHADLEGSLQAWTDPPEVAPGRYEHPGGDYQCRCVAIPVMPGD